MLDSSQRRRPCRRLQQGLVCLDPALTGSISLTDSGGTLHQVVVMQACLQPDPMFRFWPHSKDSQSKIRSIQYPNFPDRLGSEFLASRDRWGKARIDRELPPELDCCVASAVLSC